MKATEVVKGGNCPFPSPSQCLVHFTRSKSSLPFEKPMFDVFAVVDCFFNIPISF
jgi:hypothetical protein